MHRRGSSVRKRGIRQREEEMHRPAPAPLPTPRTRNESATERERGDGQRRAARPGHRPITAARAEAAAPTANGRSPRAARGAGGVSQGRRGVAGLAGTGGPIDSQPSRAVGSSARFVRPVGFAGLALQPWRRGGGHQRATIGPP